MREDQLRLRLLERTPHLRPDDREQKELEASIVERKKALGWPRGYTKSDLAEDRTRLSHFWKKRKAPWPHNKLTEEEEAEEAHLAARSDAYYNSPEAIGESQARSRSLLIGLKFFSREPPATPEEISEFAKLRVLYPSVRWGFSSGRLCGGFAAFLQEGRSNANICANPPGSLGL